MRVVGELHQPRGMQTLPRHLCAVAHADAGADAWARRPALQHDRSRRLQHVPGMLQPLHCGRARMRGLRQGRVPADAGAVARTRAAGAARPDTADAGASACASAEPAKGVQPGGAGRLHRLQRLL